MPVPVTVIGKYHVVDLLGQGGMGTLYLARDPTLDRLVAIKVLRFDVDAEKIAERFAREARSVSRLRHPNIVTLFEYGDHKGQPFIVMEYIAGESMAELIRRRAEVPIPRKLQMMEQLCAGMAYAHRAKIVHRDLKPENLMLDEETASLKILDFGIARSVESGTARHTQVIGTPSYMSPEQAAGRPLDHRSDIFAVGSVFYELLAYRRAFDGETGIAVLNKVATESPAPLGTLVRGLNPAIIAIVDKALQKNPADRYQDLETMRAEIGRAHASAHAVAPRTVTVGEPPPRPANAPRSVDLEKRRAEQISHHLRVAADAFEQGQLDRCVESCEQVLLLDSGNAAALALLDKARAAHERLIFDAHIQRAREHFAAGALNRAEEAVAEALRVRGTDRGALTLQRDLQQARDEEERMRHRAAAVEGAIARARAQLEAGAYESAARAAIEALAYAPDSEEARTLKNRALAQIDRARQDDLNQRAAESLRLARQKFDEGHRTDAITSLEQFQPPNPTIDAGLDEMRREMQAITARHGSRTTPDDSPAGAITARVRPDAAAAAAPTEPTPRRVPRSLTGPMRWTLVASVAAALAGGVGTVILRRPAPRVEPAPPPAAPEPQKAIESAPSPVQAPTPDPPAVTPPPSPASAPGPAPQAPPAAVSTARPAANKPTTIASEKALADARDALERKQYATAVKLYEQLLAQFPADARVVSALSDARATDNRQSQSAKDLARQGTQAMQARDYDTAIRQFRSALDAYPESAEIVAQLNGATAAKQRADAAAAEVLRPAGGAAQPVKSGLSDDQRSKLFAQADALVAARLIDQAVAIYDQILVAEPDNAAAKQGKAKALSLRPPKH